MPGLGQTLVIGGGIAAGSPFALDQFLYVTNVTQPTAASFPGLVRSTNGNAIAAPGSQVARANLNTVIGESNTVTNAATTRLVMIGSGLSAGTGSTPVTMYINIGQDNTTPNNTQIMVIGGGITDGGSQGTIKIGQGGGLNGIHNGAIGIGVGCTLGGGATGVTIGNNAGTSVGGNAATVVGNSSSGQTNVSVFGQGNGGHIQNCVIVGQGITITGGGGSDNILIGGQIGGTALSGALTIGNGAEALAGQITLGHNGLGGGLYSTVLLLGGATQHANVTPVPAFFQRLKSAQGLDIAAGDFTVVGPRATGNAASGSIVFQTGAAGASSSTLQTATSVFRITNAQKAEVMLDNGLTFVNQTSGAGAAGGTLTNAPSAGNPSHWLRVQINGANRFIPCWT